MIVSETIFVNRQPVGMVRQDSNSGQIDFSPLNGKSLLPQKRWRDMDELKRAIFAAYSYNEDGPLR